MLFGGIVSVIVLASASHAEPVSREVSFKGAGGFELKGTLLVPSGPGKFPAVVMLPGSGPTDRNGNQGFLKTDLLKQIAEGLAKAGIASLRFDKRSVGTTYGILYPKDPTKLDDFLSWENHVEDAKKAVNFARSRPEIDPARVGFLGHSEGAMVAMQVAGSDKPPAATLLASAPGRPLAAVVRDQIQSSLDRNPNSGVDGAKLMEDYDATVKGIIETGEVKNANPLLAPLFPAYASRYLRSMFEFDPAREALKMRGVVFVLQGENDIQISAKKDFPALSDAVKARKNATSSWLLVPGASHNLKLVKDLKSEPGFEGPIAPAAMRQIVDWFKWFLRPIPGRIPPQ